MSRAPYEALLAAPGASFAREPLRRGLGTLVYGSASSALVNYRPRAFMLYTTDAAEACRALDAAAPCAMLTVNDRAVAAYAMERFGLDTFNDCYFVVYERSEPPAVSARLDIRPPDDAAMRLIRDNYDLASDEEIALVRARGHLLCGYWQGALAGFIGRHRDGSLGMLYVFPAFRRQGFAEELEAEAVARCLAAGDTPYADVFTYNAASLALQRKLGFTVREDMRSYWVY